MILEWAATFCTLAGLWLLGYKDRRAFLVSLVANGLWITWAAPRETWSLVVVNAAIAVLNVRAWLKWSPSR